MTTPSIQAVPPSVELAETRLKPAAESTPRPSVEPVATQPASAQPPSIEPVETPPSSVEPVDTHPSSAQPPSVELVETHSSSIAELGRTPSAQGAETPCQRAITDISTRSTGNGPRFLAWRRVPGLLSEHPEWLALLVAAAAWVWLAVALGWFTSGASTLLQGHHHGPAGASEPPHSADAQLLIWTAMVLAMMLPTTVPHLRYLGFNTRASLRQRAIALFLLGYLAVWLAPGFALALLGATSPWVLVVAVLVAGAWEWTPLKRRALLRCCRTWPVGYTGPSANAAAVEYGLRHGVTCLLVTGPAMLALMLAGHPWWATVALAGVMAAQKLLTRPERWRTMVALGWLASGLAVAGLAILDAA